MLEQIINFLKGYYGDVISMDLLKRLYAINNGWIRPSTKYVESIKDTVILEWVCQIARYVNDDFANNMNKSAYELLFEYIVKCNNKSITIVDMIFNGLIPIIRNSDQRYALMHEMQKIVNNKYTDDDVRVINPKIVIEESSTMKHWKLDDDQRAALLEFCMNNNTDNKRYVYLSFEGIGDIQEGNYTKKVNVRFTDLNDTENKVFYGIANIKVTKEIIPDYDNGYDTVWTTITPSF